MFYVYFFLLQVKNKQHDGVFKMIVHLKTLRGNEHFFYYYQRHVEDTQSLFYLEALVEWIQE
jgi:hypothetical protein